MKAILFTVLVSMFASLAQAQDGTVYRFACNLSDSATPLPQSNIATQTFDLQPKQTVDFVTYNGHKYQITVEDLTGPSAVRPRHEIMLVSRNAGSHAVIGSTDVVFSQEVPDDLTYQEGSLLLNCINLDK